MGLGTEFRKFVARGNVLDLAVGVVIGAAFGKITTALTESILMPIIGWIFGDVDFSNWFVRLGPIPDGYTGSITNYPALKQAGVLMIGYGEFLTHVLNFLIIAFALFMLLKAANRAMEEIHRKQDESDDTSKDDDVPTDPQLDVLKKILAELKKDEATTAPGKGDIPA